MKLTRTQRAKIRYQLLRDNGYSVIDARKNRWDSTIDIKGIKIDKTTNNVIKKSNYKWKKGIVNIDKEHEYFKQVSTQENNKSVYTAHGFLAHKHGKYAGQYSDYVRRIQREQHLANDPAWYFANYWLQSNLTYKEVIQELATKTIYEKYKDKNWLVAYREGKRAR